MGINTNVSPAQKKPENPENLTGKATILTGLLLIILRVKLDLNQNPKG